MGIVTLEDIIEEILQVGSENISVQSEMFIETRRKLLMRPMFIWT
jgi:CBS domain containing-hemolysin-like protein